MNYPECLMCTLMERVSDKEAALVTAYCTGYLGGTIEGTIDLKMCPRHSMLVTLSKGGLDAVVDKLSESLAKKEGLQ